MNHLRKLLGSRQHIYSIQQFQGYKIRTKNVSTIYALSSGQGKCGVAVIRVSGGKASTVLMKMAKLRNVPEARKGTLRRLYHPKSNEVLDRAFLLWFPGPHSFTGEDTCEMHIHGGYAVINAVQDALASFEGLRHAEPGEYTKRAFQNGKLDLTEVDGLADLIHAETEAQRKQALRQMEGDLGKLYSKWRQDILKATANSEAYIDFGEEDNIEEDVLQQVSESVKNIAQEISAHLSDNRRGERLRNGVRVAIIGEPNVGKSSLLNLLTQRPAAIVSSIAGTTRDVVETSLNIGGYPVVLSDTAGLRTTSDVIESEGVSRAKNRAHKDDLKLLICDASSLDNGRFHDPARSSNFIHTYIQNLGLNQATNIEVDVPEIGNDGLEILNPSNTIVVFNKIDLIGYEALPKFTSQSGFRCCPLSCIKEAGTEDFMSELTSKVKGLCESASTNPSLTQERYRDQLKKCLDCLHASLELQATDIVMSAHQLHQARRHIGKITGEITSEEILDVIFRDFCIGK